MGWKETVLVLALLTEPALGLAAGKTNGKQPLPRKNGGLDTAGQGERGL